MAVQYKIPTEARFLSEVVEFSAPFNSTPGGYSFTLTPTCQNVVMFEPQPNTIYLINTISVGGNIAEEQYLGAISDFPRIYLRRRANNTIVYGQPIRLSRYFDNAEASTWMHTDQGSDALLLSLIGSLVQTAPLVGVDPVTLQVTFNFFAVDSGYFNSAYRDAQAPTMGQENRR